MVQVFARCCGSHSPSSYIRPANDWSNIYVYLQKIPVNFLLTSRTSIYTMANFAPLVEDSDVAAKFKRVKGQDFISRLNGYLNVLGPNRRQCFDKETRAWIDDDRNPDNCFPIRRAEKNIELLAVEEHNGYMEEKLRNGWAYAPVRNDALKLHHLIKTYTELTEEDKEKDRDSVRNYPKCGVSDTYGRSCNLVKFSTCIN